MRKSYINKTLNNQFYNDLGLDTLRDFFTRLNISSALRNNIIYKIDAEVDFELPVSELQEIVPALSEKINNLLSDPDFNPFKEREREEYPAAYNKFPFIWNNVTYYLYPKDNEIDSEIRRVNGYLKLIQEFINQNQSLKYIYKSS